MLSVEREYVSALPHLPDYHKDPFDRMLIATAITEGFTIVSVDENIKKYDLTVLW